MPNHLHLILAPATRDGLSRAVGEAHRRYTAFVNARARVTGHLFQGRFGCVAMDEPHMLNAVRYLAFNPVRARLCAAPGKWEWSSVRAHLRRRGDALVEVRPVLAIAPRFGDLLELSPGERAELDGSNRSAPTGVRSAMRPSSPSPNANSAEACAREARTQAQGSGSVR